MSFEDFKEKEKLVESESTEDVAPDSDELIGQTIGGHYQIESLIGTGGMSTVYKARHLLLDKPVAIKFILPKYIHDKATTDRFKQEALAASELKHPNICGVSEFGLIDDKRAFIVMDYIDGYSLANAIESDGKLEPKLAILVLLQVVEGLEYARSKGVIHRDIKPENIMLVRKSGSLPEVKIVDFGIAKLVRDDEAGPNLTQTGDVFGTPNYMSPEQCYGKKIDYKTDIYSFGCVLHETVSGAPPFKSNSSLETIFKQVNEAPPVLILGQDSQALEAVSLKCLEKDPEERYENFQLLKEDLQSVANDQSPVNAKRESIKFNMDDSSNLLGGRNAFMIALLTIIVICGSLFVIDKLNSFNQEKAWRYESKLADQALSDNNLAGAEEHLENALELAKQSKKQSLVTLSLKELSDVEKKLGKEEEASEHTRIAKSNIKVDGLHSFFLAIAGIFIAVGMSIFIATIWLFGPGADNPITRKLLEKHNQKLSKRQDNQEN